MDNVLSIYAPSYDPYDGYGRMALEMIHWMNKSKITTNAYTTAKGQLLYDTQTDAVQELLQKPLQAAMGGLLLGYPTLYDEYGGLSGSGKRVALTMFESTRLPKEWIKPLNACDAVIVPAYYLVKVFEKSGVRKPIHVVPLGISETYQYQERPRERKPYTFLCLGDRGMRKGWDIACEAFYEAFGDDMDYKLIIKARDNGLPLKITNPNIEVLCQDMTEREFYELMLACDCFVFPTRGEGFGLPPREAAASGMPVIATNWGGTADKLAAWGYPIKYELVEAWPHHKQFNGKCGRWAEPDVTHLAEQMKYIAEPQNPVLLKRINLKQYEAKRSAIRVRREYSWQKFADGVWKIYSEVVSHKSVSTKRAERKARRASNSG